MRASEHQSVGAPEPGTGSRFDASTRLFCLVALVLMWGQAPVAASPRLVQAQINTTNYPQTVTLAWETIAGNTYLLQYTPDLSADPWANAATVTASGPTLSWTDRSVFGVQQRFWRVIDLGIPADHSQCSVNLAVQPGPGIQVSVVAPEAGETMMQANARIPLIVSASDIDQLSVISTCPALQCSSTNVIDVVDSVIYRWQLRSGSGELLNQEGPATLYQAPELQYNQTVTADILAEIFDLNGQDTTANSETSVAFTITLTRLGESLYRRTVAIASQTYSGLQRQLTTDTCGLGLTSRWTAEPLPLRARVPSLVTVCAGDRAVLRASGEDADTLELICESAAPPCNRSTNAVALVDESNYFWSAQKGGFPDYGGHPVSNGRETAVVYEAPTEPGEDLVTVRVSDSGLQATDAQVEQQIRIQVLNVILRLNETDSSLDDLVMLSDPSAPNRPFTPLLVELQGPANFSTSVALAQFGPGQVSFDDPAPRLSVGTPKMIKVFGQRHSQAENDTAIIVTLNGATCVQKRLTVIQGIKVHFSGTFFFACNNNNGYRVNRPCGDEATPLTWQATPLPCEGFQPFFNSIYFQEGQTVETNGLPLERWSLDSGKRPKIEVLVTGVKSFGPEIDLDARDQFLKSGIPVLGLPNSGPRGSARAGVIFTDDCDHNSGTGNPEGNEDGVEVVARFGIRFGDSFGVSYLDSSWNARIRSAESGGPPNFAQWLNDRRDITSIFFPGTDVGCISPNITYVASDGTFKCMEDQSLKELLVRNAGFRSWERQAWANWTSRGLQAVPGANTSGSFIAKLFNDALLGQPLSDPGHAEGFLQLGRFDWYTLMGELTKGVVSTPGGIDARFGQFLRSAGCPSPMQPEEAFTDDPY